MQLLPSSAFLDIFDALEAAGSIEQEVAALGQIKDLSEPAGLPFMFGWIHHLNVTVREAADEAVRAMMKSLRPQMLRALEGAVRQSWVRYATHGAKAQATGLSSLLLTTMNPNGRFREFALRKLLLVTDASILPFVLIRLNDWVPVLRRLAEDWLSSHASKLPLSVVAGVIPVLATLMDRGQSSASAQLLALGERLRHPEAIPFLLAAIPTSDLSSRRFIFRLLSDSGALGADSVQKALIHGSDPFTGVLCLGALERSPAPVSREVLLAAVNAKSAMLRVKALQLWQARGLEGFSAVLEAHIADESCTVRQFARYWMQKAKPDFDFGSVYRTAMHVAQHRKAAAALAGFHESGGRLDQEEYAQWLQHPASIVRRVALRCLALSWPETAQPVVKQFALEGTDAALSGTAFRLIQSHRGWLAFDEIESLAINGPTVRLRIGALSLLLCEDKWRRLPVLLRLLSGDDEALRPSVASALRDWRRRFNLTWTQPSTESLHEARRWLASAASRLGKHERHDLEDLLSTAETVTVRTPPAFRL